MTRKKEKPPVILAAADCETDPFRKDRLAINPFTVGLAYGGRYFDFWGEDCFEQALAHLETVKSPMVVYWHNGGHFDFHFMLGHFRGNFKMIGPKIVEGKIGRHIHRDSLAILPVPLAKFGGKGIIKYTKLEKRSREKHRAEILAYQKTDCLELLKAVRGFQDEFSPGKTPRLTIAGTAITELQKFHKFERMDNLAEFQFLRHWFFGGRVECFESRVIEGNFIIYDVNSMYPAVMRNFLHPISARAKLGREITPETYFLTVEADSHGAFPQRQPDGSLAFPHRTGRFFVTIHEYQAAIETGAAEIKRIIETLSFEKATNFSDFVNHYAAKREIAKACRNVMGDIFYKTLPNSSYGKFCQDGSDFCEYRALDNGEFPPAGEGWKPSIAGINYEIYERPAPIRRESFYNLATGASITGAARSVLLRAIKAATRPLYCDTDSLICEGLAGVDFHPSRLGAWKQEASGELLVICGKKTYGLFSAKAPAMAAALARVKADPNAVMADEFISYKGRRYACVKMASKGNSATPQQILRAGMGEEIELTSIVPTFRLGRDSIFQRRTLRLTA